MANYVASALSLYHSAKSAADGNILRHITTAGHAYKVCKKLSNVDCTVGHALKSASDTFSAAEKNSKALKAVHGGFEVIRHTDPISATCAMIRAAKSNSPARAFLEESAGLIGMFLIEGSMDKYAKQISNIKGIKTLNDKMVQFAGKNKLFSQLPALAYGVLFTVGSELGTNFGKKIGSLLADKLNLADRDKSYEGPKQEVNENGEKVRTQKYYFG